NPGQGHSLALRAHPQSGLRRLPDGGRCNPGRRRPEMTDIQTVDVAIMGAGPVGGTLACRLATAGLRAAVIDRGPLPPMEHPAFDGRAYAITGAMRPLLEQSGVWERLPDPTCP